MSARVIDTKGRWYRTNRGIVFGRPCMDVWDAGIMTESGETYWINADTMTLVHLDDIGGNAFGFNLGGTRDLSQYEAEALAMHSVHEALRANEVGRIRA